MFALFFRFPRPALGLASLVILVSCGNKEPEVTAAAPSVAPAASAPALEVVAPAAPLAGEAALAAFRTGVEGIKAFMQANEASQDPAAAVANLRELIKRASAVKTEGLPEDLATAYQEMNRVMQRLQTALDDLPVPIAELPEYLSRERAKGTAADQEAQARVEAFRASYSTLGQEGKAASDKLKETGLKYGIVSFDLGGS